MHFRSKPVEVEAEQFREEVYPGPFDGTAVRYDAMLNFYVVPTTGDRVRVYDGDWIIREPDGRGFYPCQPSIFRERWEPCSVPPKPPTTIAASEWRRPPTFNAETRQWEPEWPKVFLAAVLYDGDKWDYWAASATNNELVDLNGDETGWTLADVTWIADINEPEAS